MDAALAAKLWQEAWDSGLWAAAWSKSVESLTAAQAAWKPAPERHSIWQILLHMCFWREVSVRRAAGGPGPDDPEVAKSNFPDPATPSDDAWRATLERFRASQQIVGKAFSAGGEILKNAPYMMAHDANHMGQIGYLRALQGLPPAE